MRDLDLATFAIAVLLELVHAHLLDALELALDEEEVGLILDAKLDLGVQITDPFISEQLSELHSFLSLRGPVTIIFIFIIFWINLEILLSIPLLFFFFFLNLLFL